MCVCLHKTRQTNNIVKTTILQIINKSSDYFNFSCFFKQIRSANVQFIYAACFEIMIIPTAASRLINQNAGADLAVNDYPVHLIVQLHR